jgi:phage terminase small subunit
MTNMSTPSPGKTLTPKQRKFIAEYFACGMNAAAAARRAGYKTRQSGAENMSNPVIRQEIDRLYRENTIPAAEVLARLSDHARADIADVIGADGQLNLKKAYRRGKTGLIKSITHTTTTFKGVETVTVKVELHDSQKAMQLLGKYHKLFVDRVQVDDWRSQAIQDIKAGALDYPTLESLFDTTLAQELFRAAGVSVEIDDRPESSGSSSVSD